MVVHVQDSLPHEVSLGEIECIGSAERSKDDGPRRAWSYSETSLELGGCAVRYFGENQRAEKDEV